MTLSFKKTALTLAVLASTGLTSAAFAQSFSDAQKEEMGAVIKEYLMENPSVIFESIEAYRAQEEENARKQAEVKISDNIAYLTRADAPSIGNPDADVTVVEFFDYNCGYCKRALPDIQALTDDDPNVRVVFKEMPILGPTSRTAALWALAAHKQGKYFDYHVALMEHRGPKEEAELEKLAKGLDLDVEKMKADIASGEIAKEVDKVLEVGRDIGVSGTPAFIVGETFVPGYVGEDGLKSAVQTERDAQEAKQNTP